MVCNYDDKNLTNKTNERKTARTFTSRVNFHVLVVTLSLVSLAFQHAYAISSVEFFPSGCCSSCCSQTVFSDSQFHL